MNPSPNQWDVVVVGAGPAGSTTAYFAAEAGLKVLLLEKHPAIGVPVCCGEGISKNGLEDVFTPEPAWIAATIEGAYLIAPSGKRAKVVHPDAGYILERKIFDRDLAIMAARKGAELRVNANMIGLEQQGSGWRVDIDMPWSTESVTARYVVGADGIESKVGRYAGLGNATNKLTTIHTAAQYQLVTDEFELGMVEFAIGHDVAPGGYGWVFPKGPRSANVGIGLSTSHVPKGGGKARDYLNQYVEARFQSRSIAEVSVGGVPAGKCKYPLHKDGVLLVGDAANQTDPLSGGGIHTALMGGKLAAAAMVNHSRSGLQSALEAYPREWDNVLGNQMAYHHKAREVFLKLKDPELEEVVDYILNVFKGRSVTAIDTMYMCRTMVLSNPKLLLLARHLV